MDPGNLRVYLSRRNLRTLLAKLDGYPEWTAATLFFDQPETPRLWVIGEEDEAHYSHPSREGMGAGIMHPETEDRL